MPGSTRKVFRRKILAIRLYVLSLALMLALALTALLSQTAFAKTYVITDGDRVVTYTTFATDPAEVLGQAGLPLGEYDTYTTGSVEGAEAITIQRAQDITIHYHGQITKTTSFGETAGELLQRLNLVVSGEDVISHGLEEPVCSGMELRIDRIVTRQEIYTTTVAHQTSYCDDPTIPEGMEAVLVEGVDGEMLCTAEVTYVNGQENQRDQLSETVTRAPVTEIIGVGTGTHSDQVDPEAMPVIGDGFITLPTGEVLTYTDTATIRATAYTHTDECCDFVTATGTTVHWGTVAVDPRYIPYGTRMFIVSNDGEYVYGIAVAEDCGGAIKGDRMDLYMPTHAECIAFGRRTCTIYYLG